MLKTNSKSPPLPPGQLSTNPAAQLSRAGRLNQKTASIRVKLTLLTLVLIALITTGSSMVAIQNMDQELLDALAKRGASIALSAAIPAGYSILSEDHLALDNLAAKIEESQEDIAYLAILDNKGNILAHNKLTEIGLPFESVIGEQIRQTPDYTMKLVTRDGQPSYEFISPIQFANERIGQIVVGIDAQTLYVAREAAQGRIILISIAALAFGTLCSFLLSRLFTAPIERLAAGVSQLTAGNHHVEVKVTSKDELGQLTRSFNEMSRVIMSQQKHLEDYASNLEKSYISTVKILAAALDARDNYTLGHSSRVARLSLLIGQRLGLNSDELKDLEMACFLHDIGKIHVPDDILNKPVPLNQSELQLIRKHPEQGAEILQLAESLHQYIPVILHHHEWYNGQGYPHGLKGEEININAQIVSIADTYDAMTSSRPYRKGCTRDEAAAEIIKYRGTQFNPELTDIFLVALNDYDDDQVLFSTGAHHETHHFLYSHSAYRPGDVNRLHDSAFRDKDHKADKRSSH